MGMWEERRKKGALHAHYQQGAKAQPCRDLGAAWHTRQASASAEDSEDAMLLVHWLPVCFLLLGHQWQGEGVLGLTEAGAAGQQGRCQWCGQSVSASWAPGAVGARPPGGEKGACFSPFRLL